MDKLWKDQTFSFGVKLRFLRSIVISVLLYGCESWTYKEERFNLSVTEDYWASLGGTDAQTSQ